MSLLNAHTSAGGRSITTPELIQFLYDAKGSAGEVRSVCYVMDRMKVFEHLKSEISDLKSSARAHPIRTALQ